MNKIKNKQVIYTDGSCIPNPGPGGWAFAALSDITDEYPTEWHMSGGEYMTTNNRMELLSVIQALEFFPTKKDYVIYSDSQYVINCAKGKWNRKKNTDLWEKYDKISNDVNIEWVWVKGHSGNKYNEIVDLLAKQEAKIKK
jgi:ribonuclease HI